MDLVFQKDTHMEAEETSGLWCMAGRPRRDAVKISHE